MSTPDRAAKRDYLEAGTHRLTVERVFRKKFNCTQTLFVVEFSNNTSFVIDEGQARGKARIRAFVEALLGVSDAEESASASLSKKTNPARGRVLVAAVENVIVPETGRALLQHKWLHVEQTEGEIATSRQLLDALKDDEMAHKPTLPYGTYELVVEKCSDNYDGDYHKGVQFRITKSSSAEDVGKIYSYTAKANGHLLATTGLRNIVGSVLNVPQETLDWVLVEAMFAPAQPARGQRLELVVEQALHRAGHHYRDYRYKHMPMTPEMLAANRAALDATGSSGIAGATSVAINDHTCPSCRNDKCSKSEKSCWKCGSPL